MAKITYSGVEITSEFTTKSGELNSGESIGELFGKTAGHIADGDIHVTAEEKAGWNALSNPNLLINSDFRINQRGKSVYHNEGFSQYTVDRWFLQEWYTKLTVTDSGVRVELDSEADRAIALYQVLRGAKIQYGECYSLSVKNGGKLYSASGVINSTSDKVEHWDGQFHFVAGYSDSAGSWVVNLISDHGAPLELEWVKFELNTKPTKYLAPDSTLELAKCQRYYQIRSTGDIDPVDLRPNMGTITDIIAVEGGYAYVAEL